MAKISFRELSEKEKKLLRAAKRAIKRARARYSGFPVGAAVLTKDGKIISGTNFEVASFESICAERAALVSANNRGHGDKCVAIAIVTRNKDSPNSQASNPCGTCRQFIYEAAQMSGIGKAFKIITATTKLDGEIEVTNIGKLLPHAFGPEDLKATDSLKDSN